MRLLESEQYRGKQISVYVVYPDGPSRAPMPSLGVRVDGKVVQDEAFLQNIHELQGALDWGRNAVDRLLGLDHAPERMLLPSPV